MANKLNHSPGVFSTRMTNDGQVQIRAKDGDAPFENVGRVSPHNGELAKHMREVPHDCDHQDCPGPQNRRRLNKYDDLVTKGQAAIASLQNAYPQFVTVLGQSATDAIWTAFLALENELPD